MAIYFKQLSLSFGGGTMKKALLFTIVAVCCIVLNEASAQRVRFFTTPKAVARGDTAWLKWVITGMNKNQLERISIRVVKGEMLLEGLDGMKDSLMIIGDAPRSYQLVYQRKLGRDMRRVTKLRVYHPIFGFVYGPDSAISGDAFPVEWQCTYAEYVLIGKDTTKYDPSGSTMLVADTSGMVTFTAYNRHGYSTAYTMRYKPADSQVFYADTVICAGDPATIVWDLPGADSVQLSDLPDSLFSSIDHITLFPKKTEVHTFKYISDGKIHERTFRIHVLPKGTFWVDVPQMARIGDEVKVQWKFNDNKNIYIRELKSRYPAEGTVNITARNSQSVSFDFEYLDKPYTVTRRLTVQSRQLMAGYREIKDLKNEERLVFEIFGADQSAYPDSVKVMVAVYDLRGYFVKSIVGDNERHDMTRKYFKGLVESIDGIAYPVEAFTVREVNKEHETFDFSFALDYSGSMSGDIQMLEKAVSEIVTTKSPDDRMAFVRFDHRIVNVSPLDASKDSLMSRLNMKGLDTLGGSTALYAGTYDAIINTGSNAPNKRVIVFTDGFENSSARYLGEKAASGQELVDISRQYDLPLTFVAFGRGTNENLLDMLAWMSNGSYYNLRSSKQIQKVFNEIIRMSKYYYEITYKPVMKEGEHDLTLMYYDNKKNTETSRRMYFGAEFDLTKTETESMLITGQITPAVDSVISQSGSAITSPQVVSLFDYDNDKIDPSYLSNIVDYATILRNNKQYKAIIIGHSDMKGSDRGCQLISERRANAVRNLLLSYGVDPGRVKAVGVGRSNPVWNPEFNEVQARENRRVEIVIIL